MISFSVLLQYIQTEYPDIFKGIEEFLRVAVPELEELLTQLD